MRTCDSVESFSIDRSVQLFIFQVITHKDLLIFKYGDNFSELWRMCECQKRACYWEFILRGNLSELIRKGLAGEREQVYFPLKRSSRGMRCWKIPRQQQPTPRREDLRASDIVPDIKVLLLWQGHWFKIESTTSGPESGRACWVQEQPASRRVSNLSLEIASWAHCFPSQGTSAWWFF